MILNIIIALAFLYLLYRLSVSLRDWFKELEEAEHQDWWSYMESQRQKSKKKK
tara:strand:+ start:2568 stop:2726 length:159 start_codon:yes stop_codon:yes gene_type:complete